MTQTNTPPRWTKRLLSAAIVLALLLAYLPAGLIATAAEGSLIPDSVSRLVYVAAEGTELPEGATSYTSLEEAMEQLSAADPDAAAIIVVVGTVTSNQTWNNDGAVSHNGTYYITGKYGDYQDGVLNFYKSGNSTTNYIFGGPVVIENLQIAQRRDKYLNIHASSSLTIGENVTTGGYTEKICLIGGSFHDDVENVEIKISSGSWKFVRAGNNTKNITGTATITIGGTAVIDTLAASGNAAFDVNKVIMNINAGTVNTLNFSGTNASATNGDVTLNLNAGTVGSIDKGAGSINENSSITVNVGENFVMGDMTMAVESALDTDNTITTTLNLGEVEEEPAATLKAEFDTVNYTLPPAPEPALVYVDGTETEKGDGSKEAPFQTLTEAYAYIADTVPSLGGTIVISGKTELTASTNFESNTITGLVTLTSNNNAVLAVSGSDDISLYFGPKTKFENISLDASEASALFLFTGAEMTLGEGITTSGTLKIFCCDSAPASSADEAKDASLTVQSGAYDTIFMGSGTASTYVGNVTLDLAGTADVRLLVTGGNKGHVGNLTVDISTSKLVDIIANTPASATAQVGDVVLSLNGCSVGEMRAYRTGNDRTYYVKSFTVNVKANTTLPSTFGVFSKMMLPDNTTTPISPVLNLESYKGSVSLSSFASVNLTGACEVTSASELTNQNITVGANSTLILTHPNYSDVSSLPAGVVITASKGGTVTDAAYGKVYYKEITYPSVVFVDGKVSVSGDGLTPETAVKTLPEAYALLSPVNGGKVVLCGALTTAATTNLENVSGEVEITSVHDGVDYRKTKGAVLTFPSDSKVYITFGDKTHINNLTMVCLSGTIYMDCGADLLLGEGLSITQNKQLKLFMTDSSPASSADNAKNFKLTILSGDYESIWMGCRTEGGYVGDVTYTQGGTASVRLLVMAGNKGATGKITANMEGGTVTKLTTNGAAANNLTVGDVTVNLKGCAVKALTSYGGNDIYGKSFTVNVYMDQIGSLPSQMGYYDQSYLPGTTTRIPLTLNYFNYNGSSVPVAGYDVVNLFGGNEIPENYVSPAESGKSVLAIHGFTGITSVDLANFDKLVATGNSDVTCAGSVPTSLVLSATGSKLRIRPSQQPAGTAFADYVIANNDQVLWEEPAYTEHDVIFGLDFENEYAATGNVTVNSVNNGYTTSFQNGGFVTGFDGKTGLYLVNEFGTAAQNYLTVDLSGSGYDITKEDYTVTFWYRTENGGNDQWARGIHATVAGTEVNMPAYNMGGTIFSNQDTKLDTAGMSFLQLTHYKYTSAGFTAVDGTHCDADGIWQAQDDTWHHVVVSYDRDGDYCVYVDGELITITDISAYKNDVLGVNALTFGADALGQYGLGNAIIDNITVFSGALNVVDAQAQYYASCLNAEAHEINTRLEQVGAEYDAYKTNMVATLESVLAQSANLGATDYATLISLHNTLMSAYESFMAAPEKDALLTMLLSSDIHFGAAGTVERFDNVLAQLVELGVDLDVIMSGGDFADKPDTDIVTKAYEDLFALMDKHGLDDTLFVNCLGNHDAYYRNAEANYQTAIPLYWQYMMGHMEDMIADGTVKLDHASYYKDDNGIVQSCSYAVTFQGYHFLAINTDYPPGGQTDNSGNYKDENGNYSIEGNEVDPIRHTMHLKDETLEWMDEILDEWAKDGMPVFAAGHYLFENTCPLSFNDEIVINSNTIGKQDQQLREILAAHKNVFYFCGHVHASLGVIDPWLVEVDGVGSFWELNLAAIKASARAYLNVPSTWIMYVYEDEVVLRARDFSTGKWLTEFDVVIKLTCPHLSEDVTAVPAAGSTCSAPGNSAYWHCADCGKYFSDAACTAEIEKDSWITGIADHSLTHVSAVAPTEDADGNIEHWYCESCHKYYANADASEEIAKEDVVVIFSPETGDNAILIPMILLVILAVTGAAITLFSKKYWLK